MEVQSTLGPGYVESVCRNALSFELRRGGVQVEAEKPVNVFYEEQLVGAFLTDLLLNGKLLLELKAVLALVKAHEVQLVNYLTATGIEEGLLLNFGAARLQFKKKFRHPKSEPGSFDL